LAPLSHGNDALPCCGDVLDAVAKAVPRGEPLLDVGPAYNGPY
jgi:hypothetical protein